MHMHVNKNIISAKLTWELIKYLGLLVFSLLGVVPIPFAWSLSACLSWMGDPCTTDQAQKREINKSLRFDAHQSPSRGRMGGKALPQIWFDVGMLCQHRLEIPSPQRS